MPTAFLPLGYQLNITLDLPLIRLLWFTRSNGHLTARSCTHSVDGYIERLARDSKNRISEPVFGSTGADMLSFIPRMQETFPRRYLVCIGESAPHSNHAIKQSNTRTTTNCASHDASGVRAGVSQIEHLFLVNLHRRTEDDQCQVHDAANAIK
jgi:hypothetical protein